jgi:hypothetical protein
MRLQLSLSDGQRRQRTGKENQALEQVYRWPKTLHATALPDVAIAHCYAGFWKGCLLMICSAGTNTDKTENAELAAGLLALNKARKKLQGGGL